MSDPAINQERCCYIYNPRGTVGRGIDICGRLRSALAHEQDHEFIAAASVSLDESDSLDRRFVEKVREILDAHDRQRICLYAESCSCINAVAGAYFDVYGKPIGGE